MTVVIVCSFLLLVAYFIHKYEPFVDVTCEGDVLLWYNSKDGSRKYKLLFKIKQ